VIDDAVSIARCPDASLSDASRADAGTAASIQTITMAVAGLAHGQRKRKGASCPLSLLGAVHLLTSASNPESNAVSTIVLPAWRLQP
jgi:hypothetical protein